MAEYIDREVAIAAVKLIIGDQDHECKAMMDFYCALRNIPAADVAPVVHGKWESCFEDWRKQIEGDKCSACGYEHYGTNIRHYHYCPNCGAKMDGDADE